MYAMIIVLILLVVTVSTLLNPTKKVEQYSYSKLITQIKNNEISKIEIVREVDSANVGRVRVYLNTQQEEENLEEQPIRERIRNENRPNYELVDLVDISSFVALIHDELLDAGYNPNDLTVITTLQRTSWITTMLPMIITVVIAIFLLMVIIQQIQGSGGSGRALSFGKTKARVNLDDKNKLTFKDIAGLEEEKAELEEVIEFLKNPKKFVEIGARIPKGVLLVGIPGTGKTYLAKAVAGEASVPFFSISGSDFVEMFVGVGASRVRDLFEQAKKNLPCIVFIDEIDAVGRRRGPGLGGGHDEREQTLNQLLVEMDGFGVNEGIIVMAATNRHDILDPALLRPGRFDRHIMVSPPDVKGREAVLKVHAKGKKLDEKVDLEAVAKTTAGFTPADLANLLNESALWAARNGKEKISMDDIKKAYVKVTCGTEKKSRVIIQREREITAYHEAGHAILHEVLDLMDPTYIISIIPTGHAGGYTMHIPDDDKSYHTKRFMEQTIVTLFGGRAAEEIIIKDITTGASNDIERATSIARSMVTKYGMSKELGPILFGRETEDVYTGSGSKNYGSKVQSLIDEEVKRIITEAYDESIRIINQHIDVLHKMAKLLLEKEKITGEEVRDLFPYGVLINKRKTESFLTTESN